MSRIERMYCLMNISCLTLSLDISILLHTWQNLVCFGQLLNGDRLCLSWGTCISLASNPGHIWASGHLRLFCILWLKRKVQQFKESNPIDKNDWKLLSRRIKLKSNPVSMRTFFEKSYWIKLYQEHKRCQRRVLDWVFMRLENCTFPVRTTYSLKKCLSSQRKMR